MSADEHRVQLQPGSSSRASIVKCIVAAGVILNPFVVDSFRVDASMIDIAKHAGANFDVLSQATADSRAEKILRMVPTSPYKQISKEEWADIVRTCFNAQVVKAGNDDFMMKFILSSMESKDKFTTRSGVDIMKLLLDQQSGSGGDPYEKIRYALLGHDPASNEALYAGLKGIHRYYRYVTKLEKKLRHSSRRERDTLQRERALMKQHLSGVYMDTRDAVRQISGAGNLAVRNEIRKCLRINQGIQTLGWNIMQEESGKTLIAVDVTEGNDAEITAQLPLHQSDNCYVLRAAMHVKLPTSKLRFEDGVLVLEDGEGPLEFTEENFSQIADVLRKQSNSEMLWGMLSGKVDSNKMLLGAFGGGGSDTAKVLSALQQHPEKVLNALNAREPDMMKQLCSDMMSKYMEQMDPKMSAMMRLMGNDFTERKVQSVWEIVTAANSRKIMNRIKSIGSSVPDLWKAKMTNGRVNCNSVRVRVRPTSVAHEFTGYLLCRSSADAKRIAEKIDQDYTGAYSSA